MSLELEEEKADQKTVSLMQDCFFWDMLTGNYDRTYDARVECSCAEYDELRREVSKGKQVGHERNVVDPANQHDVQPVAFENAHACTHMSSSTYVLSEM